MKVFFCKAQSGLEYLMTYGWSLILIVSIASVLFFIFSSNNPTQPVFSSSNPAKILLKSGNVTTNAVELYLQNATGGRLNITSLSSAEYSSCTVNGNTLPVNIDGGGTMKINCTAPFDGKGNLLINYIDFAGNQKKLLISSSGAPSTTLLSDNCTLASECNDSNPCTVDSCSGSPKVCTFTPVSCANGDGCCSGGCVFATDNDCPDTSIIAFYKFEEGSGTVAADSSGSGNNGTILNGPSWQSSGCVNGKCLNFDGINDYVDCGNNPSEQITGNMTISFWARATDVSSARRNPICKSYGAEFCLTMEPGGYLSYYHGSAGANSDPYASFNAGSMFSQNIWSHIVITRNVSTRTMTSYKNGVFSNTVTWTSDRDPSISPSYTLKIGQGYVSNFPGKIDEVKIFNRTINASEACSLCNENAVAAGITCSC